MVAITGTELQEWVEHMSLGWKNLLLAHTEILSFPCAIRETKSVAELLQHIVAVELRYAERLNELPQTGYESIPYDSVDAIYATHDRAMELLRPLMDRDGQFWETVLEFKTRSAGTLRASRRTVLVHLLTHSVRHYAQLATLVRERGVASGLDMDYILMHLEPSAA
ncbi:MAG TPA: DinB family protein [Terracidiphilus sp.]|nr:DinB family protein [Terracidiphilus sp.]